MISKNGYKCNLCERKYTKFHSLSRHLKKVHPRQYNWKHPPYTPMTSQERFECERCNQTFYFAVALYNHTRIMHVHEKLSLKCLNCKKYFESYVALIRHEKAVHKTMTCRNYYNCDDCGKKCATFENFYAHRRNFHSGIPFKPYESISRRATQSPAVCPICGKIYHKYVLKRHIKEVHSGYTYTCKICSKSFKTAMYLKMHESIHSREIGRHICDICGCTTKHGSSLWRHKIRHHSKERPHKCEFCDRSYCFPSELLAHKRSRHSGSQKDASQ